MIDTSEMTLNQIRVAGMEALARELGPVGLIRFLQTFEKGQGDYSIQREAILPAMTAEQIAEAVRQNRQKQNP
ncbi:MAG: hypothetical protein ACKV2V_11090 [Blastocatellia bacterium]